MLPGELAARLLSKLAAVAHDVEDAQTTAAALAQQLEADDAGAGADEAIRWLRHLEQALDRMQLECADAQHSSRQLRDQLPSSPVLQLRLLD